MRDAPLWHWAVWGLICLTLLRWLVLAISPLELYGDEAQYWTWSRSFEFGYFTKPPLIAWIIAASTSVFGDDAFGVRFAAPLCHAIAALFIGLSARDLAGPRIGALAMFAYATLPAVSYSSLIISTDAPLLACWGVALWTFVRLLLTRRLGWAVATGLAVAVGLNAKYAMGFFLLCAGLHALFVRDARWLLRSHCGAVVLLLGLAGLIPNLQWNMAHGWATVDHTADNANWNGPLLHVGKGLEFVAAQFGVFGPVLFAALVLLIVRWLRGLVTDPGIRLGLMFALPILALITIQAFLSRAHANWAATAYVGASLAVMLALVEPRFRLWLSGSFALHGVVAVGLYLVVALADVMPWPDGRDPFLRLRGWDAAATAIESERDARDGDRIVLSDDRMLLASLIHAARDGNMRFAAFDVDGVPGNHYELTMPYDRDAAAPALFVSVYPDPANGLAAATSLGPRQAITVPAGPDGERVFYLWTVN